MSVLAISVPVTDSGEKIVRILCIYYLVQFQGQEGQEQISALFNSSSKVNAMNPAFARKLGLHIWKTNIGAQKIDGSTLKTFGMVIANFQVEDQDGKHRFFQKTFLVVDTTFEMILEMLFLNISNADVVFGKGTLMWKSYITNKALLTTKQAQLINPKKFVIAALNTDSKTFDIYMAIRKREEMVMDLDKKGQIKA